MTLFGSKDSVRWKKYLILLHAQILSFTCESGPFSDRRGSSTHSDPPGYGPALSNIPTPRPTPLTIPNGIWIQSAVLPQYTFWTDWQTDRQTDRPTHTHTQTDRWTRRHVYTISAQALYIDIESDVLKIKGAWPNDLVHFDDTKMKISLINYIFGVFTFTE